MGVAEDDLAPQRSWPVVPPPQSDESLSSWLDRIGGEYGVDGHDLLGPGGRATGTAGGDIDADPPAPPIRWLARKTGQNPRRIRAMTLSGYVPFLLDGLTPATARLAPYVSRARLVSRPGEPIVGIEAVPWLDARWGMLWGCTACLASDAVPYRRRSWRLPWMLTCPVHGCFLTKVLVKPGRSWTAVAAPLGHASPEPALLHLDGTTRQAIHCGVAKVLGGRVDGGTWMRLLRAILEELARLDLDSSPRGLGIAEVWYDLGIPPPSAAVRPYPYEVLPPRQKLHYMRAAAVVVERAQSLLTEWMDGNGQALLDPKGQELRRRG